MASVHVARLTDGACHIGPNEIGARVDSLISGLEGALSKEGHDLNAVCILELRQRWEAVRYCLGGELPLGMRDRQIRFLIRILRQEHKLDEERIAGYLHSCRVSSDLTPNPPLDLSLSLRVTSYVPHALDMATFFVRPTATEKRAKELQSMIASGINDALPGSLLMNVRSTCEERAAKDSSDQAADSAWVLSYVTQLNRDSLS